MWETQANPHVAALPVEFLNHLLEIILKDVEDQPVGNARVNVTAGDNTSVDMISRTDGRVILVAPWDVQTPGRFTSADHVFFRVSRMQVLLLPKRAFSEEAEFSEFEETANKYHQEAATS